MARRRARKSPWTVAVQRSVDALTRSSLRAGSKMIRQAVRPATTAGALAALPALPGLPGLSGSGRAPASRDGLAGCVSGMAFSASGARRYYLYRPPGLRLGDRLPLLVMLHGCGQDAGSFSLSTRVNRVAAREGFLVLYPQQDRLANPQGCWNWYGTRSRQAYGEAAILLAAIDQVCLLYPVDRKRVALAGLSAGASMAALLATRYPERFRALVMHSGVPPGTADSAASAVGAMRGRRGPAALEDTVPLPPLLVIQGSADRVVAVSNGEAAARQWAAAAGAAGVRSRRVQRGARYPMVVSDFAVNGKVAATLCLVEGLGHAWSGGDRGQRFSDARGPDASRMIWAFMARQFKASG